tara:strand:- start:226 stop:948 length:723 start_codon:yes stop_codon:yes gene_type:complete
MKTTLESIAFRTAIYFGHLSRQLSSRDSFGRILLGSNDSYYKCPCYVYLFQTDYEEYRKFGISKFPEKRAKTCNKTEKDLYKELLFSFKCDDRFTACAIEQGLIERPENLTVFASHHLFLRPKVEKYLEHERRQFDFFKKRGSHCTELTVLNKEEIEEIVQELFEDWKNLSAHEFFNKHAPETMERLNKNIKGLLNNYLFLAKGEDYLTLTSKRDLAGREIVPLEKIPEVYKEIYGKEMI